MVSRMHSASAVHASAGGSHRADEMGRGLLWGIRFFGVRETVWHHMRCEKEIQTRSFQLPPFASFCSSLPPSALLEVFLAPIFLHPHLPSTLTCPPPPIMGSCLFRTNANLVEPRNSSSRPPSSGLTLLWSPGLTLTPRFGRQVRQRDDQRSHRRLGCSKPGGETLQDRRCRRRHCRGVTGAVAGGFIGVVRHCRRHCSHVDPDDVSPRQNAWTSTDNKIAKVMQTRWAVQLHCGGWWVVVGGSTA